MLLAFMTVAILALVPQLVFVALFSGMGAGVLVHQKLHDFPWLTHGFVALAVSCLFFMYLIDAGLWASRRLKFVKNVLFGLTFTELYLAVFSLGARYPYAPMVLFLVIRLVFMFMEQYSYV